MKFFNKYFLLTFLFALPILGQNPPVNPFSGTLVLGLEGGITLSKTDYPNTKLGGRLTGAIEYYIPTSSNHILGFRFFGGGEQINSSEKNKVITINGVGPDTLPETINTDIYLLGLGLIYSYSINNQLFPYLSFGISNLWFSPKIENGKRAPRNDFNKYKRNAIAYDIDLGLKYSVSENLCIKLEGGFHYPNTDNIDDISTGTNKDFYATTILGISYSLFGSKDSDGDGILDDMDQCPNEPEDFDGFQDEDGCPDVDNDQDGILDFKDKCPDTPEDFDGFQDEDGCPDIDNDGDGIIDELDECPNEAEDFDKFQDEDGCPDIDNDGDGILDTEDKCPDVPGPRSNNGCPSEGNIEGENTKAPKEIVIECEATFTQEKADILPEAITELDRIVKILLLYPDADWRIEGHTDKQESGNLMIRSLSLRRAEAILNYFVSKGLPSYQFTVYDMGDKFPVANNNTEYGRMKNRRIVLVREK